MENSCNHFFPRFFLSSLSRFSPFHPFLLTQMLRRGAAALLRRGVRSFADDASAAAATAAGGDAASGEASRRAFLEKFAPLVSSTTAPPSFPSDFLPKEKAEEAAAATAGVPDKLKFSFYLPHGQPVDRQPVRRELFFFFSPCNCGGGGALELMMLFSASVFSTASDAPSLQLSSPAREAARAAEKGEEIQLIKGLAVALKC